MSFSSHSAGSVVVLAFGSIVVLALGSIVVLAFGSIVVVASPPRKSKSKLKEGQLKWVTLVADHVCC